MQPTPFRLSQALWTAFQAAKPTRKQLPLKYLRPTSAQFVRAPWPKPTSQSPFQECVRRYSEDSKIPDVEKKIKDAEQKINQALDSRADIAQNAEPSLKPAKDETIVHTSPEASSIVFTKQRPSDTSQKSEPEKEDRSEPDAKEDQSKPGTKDDATSHSRKYAEWAASRWQNSPLPSQIASLRFRATKQFTSFMDNLQSNIVVAAHHLNDLTGYTGIERLKKEIEAQETGVQNARQHVKDSRERYTEAISKRSDTQREVNDLLHRKHAWSPTDLERFTTLYRSDHANEQTEQKAHEQVTQAEAQYEEASTRLAKSILARYHEEQIWSDKIRQMSTWGTWGLMGLNVLLFIIFQIAVEPWRRRRLVKGFEEKVQAALAEKEKSTDEKFAVLRAERGGDEIVQEAVQKQPEGLVAKAAEEIAEAIADAVSGSTASSTETTSVPDAQEIENVAEQVAQKELEEEIGGQAQLATSTVTDNINPDPSVYTPETIEPPETDDSIPTPPSISEPEPELQPHPIRSPETWQEQIIFTYEYAVTATAATLKQYRNALARRLNTTEYVVLSQRELTTRVLEGVAAGVAVGCGFIFIFVRGR